MSGFSKYSCEKVNLQQASLSLMEAENLHLPLKNFFKWRYNLHTVKGIDLKWYSLISFNNALSRSPISFQGIEHCYHPERSLVV